MRISIPKKNISSLRLPLVFEFHSLTAFESPIPVNSISLFNCDQESTGPLTFGFTSTPEDTVEFFPEEQAEEVLSFPSSTAPVEEASNSPRNPVPGAVPGAVPAQRNS